MRDIKWLLDRGAKVDSALPDGTTALQLAVANNQIDSCRLLIQHKANVKAAIRKSGYSITPLALALDRKSKEISLLLIANGANVNAPDGRDYAPDYPLEHAAWPEPDNWEGQGEVIDALLAKGAKSPWLSRIKFAFLSNICGLIPAQGGGQECDRARFPWLHKCESRKNVWSPLESCC